MRIASIGNSVAPGNQVRTPEPHDPVRAPDAPWFVLPALSPEVFEPIRRRLVLDCCKWDPQVGDIASLAPFPLVLKADVWRQLAFWAEQLSAEMELAEQEVLEAPALLRQLGLPWRVRRVIRAAAQRPTPALARVVRFDFHWTTDGWRISEANSDVPGGYCEASSFAAEMARWYPRASTAGDPAAALCSAIAAALPSGAHVALLSAPGYMEDQQVTAHLAHRLNERGLKAHLANPRQLFWNGQHALLRLDSRLESIDAVFRFHQGEWFARLPGRCWRKLLAGGATLVCNPAVAIISESKRFPLVWDKLDARLPTWQQLLPETRDPRDAPWQHAAEGWLLKSAYCNTGDAVASADLVDAKEWKQVCREVRRHPDRWIAQRRFTPVPLETQSGTMFPCIGVYTVNGKAAGVYGRLGRRSVIDYAAMDVAVLVEGEAHGARGTGGARRG